MKTAQVGNTKYYLLSKSMLIGSSTQTVCGWMHEEYIIEWNQRLLIEPTYNTNSVAYYKSKNVFPSIFYEMDDAREFWTNEQTKDPLWKYNDFSTNRMNPNIMRFPILTKGEISADIYSVALFASLYSEDDANLMLKLEELLEEFKAKEKTNNVDISIITVKDTYLQKQKMKEILRLYDWSETEINSYILYLKDGGTTSFVGYAPTKTSKTQYQLFDYVLFFSYYELEEIIYQLNKINELYVVSDANAFQDAIVKIGQEMLSQFNEDEIRNMDMDKLLGQIYGIPVPLNLCGLDIKKIPAMEKDDLRDYITVFKNKLDNLKRIKSDSNYNGRFQNNLINYYWIPMDAMPGVYEDCDQIKFNI